MLIPASINAFLLSTILYHMTGLLTVVALSSFSRPISQHGHSRLWSWCSTVRSSVLLCITRQLQLQLLGLQALLRVLLPLVQLSQALLLDHFSQPRRVPGILWILTLLYRRASWTWP